jgi:ABC-2 type transport system ATP-binding protein/lipopolysaccharide transport system ATP-binding protein
VTDNVIEMAAVSKRYLLGEDHPGASLRETLAYGLGRLRPGAPRPRRDELWSLRDIDLEVAGGTSLGIIGRNGAGKSTILKVLSRITEPTSGVSRTRGRVSALLEVGTGFHPELSGRENIYLNGAILGMRRRDIDGRLEEIVEFSGVGRFIDTPIKRYSSGMYLRLAFAVAAHLEPDILLVDEVLAVGDAEFQRKCLDTMASVESSGRTVVFVSHDLGAIASLCDTSVWLDGGRIRRRGRTSDVIADYLASAAVAGGACTFTERPGAPVSLLGITVRDHRGVATTLLSRGQSFSISLRVRLGVELPGMDCAIYVATRGGVRVFDEMWSDRVARRPTGPGEYEVSAVVPPCLNVGDYLVGVWLGTSYEAFFDDPAVATLRLEGSTSDRPGRLVELPLEWTHEQTGPGASGSGNIQGGSWARSASNSTSPS